MVRKVFECPGREFPKVDDEAETRFCRFQTFLACVIWVTSRVRQHFDDVAPVRVEQERWALPDIPMVLYVESLRLS